MKSAFFALLKSPNVIIGMITALIFQIVFSVIWLTGYDNITSHTDRLKILVMNQDASVGKQIAQNLTHGLKFRVLQSEDLQDALAQLDQRKVQMVVNIPANFTASLQNPAEKASVKYSINESNPSMVKSVMQTVADRITESVNEQSVNSGIQTAMTGMHVPQPQASAMAQALSQRVTGEMNNVHPLSNFSWIMVPMMLVMASFIKQIEKTPSSIRGR
jgi:uncharacterized phage infection (PIP) family protein YhgE